MNKLSKDKINKDFNIICKRIEEGESLRNVLKNKELFSTTVFYNLVDSDKDKNKQYARACQLRADNIFEEILEIADKQGNDVVINDEGKEVIDHNIVNRNRLQVDARKWMLSKMYPKKYGDKQEIDHTTKGESLNEIGNLSTDELIKRAEALKNISDNVKS